MSEKKQPQWKKVSELRPGTHGHTMNLKVVKAQVSIATADCATGGQLDALHLVVAAVAVAAVFS
jgi:hypothetical protein